MDLTEIEKDLIDGLMVLGADEEEITGIVLLLETEEMQNEMITYMLEHRNATQQNLLQEAIRIRRTMI